MIQEPQPPADEAPSGNDALWSFLRAVPRRYRLPRLPSLTEAMASRHEHPATTLAYAIEHARRARLHGAEPEPAARHVFLSSLAALIHDAMQVENGDPAIRAMVLRYHDAVVREYASLAAHASADRRRVQRLVNAAAHPGKLRNLSSQQAEFLTGLHALADAESWEGLALGLRQVPPNVTLPKRLAALPQSAPLERLQRLDALAQLDAVKRYKAMRVQIGPRARSEDAMAEGSASHERGAAVEAAVARVLETLARRLNERPTDYVYQVGTSMRAPATLPADHHLAKTEWDVVLLHRRQSDEGVEAWKIGLLVEAKASVDAAASDLRRLLRGLHLLAQADAEKNYVFQTRQGAVALCGSSLRSLADHGPGFEAVVFYCTNAADHATPRLLSAASRMQLLSAPASLQYAATPVERAAAADLEPVWKALLTEPRWQAVLNQYPTLGRALELMVHLDDLEAAVDHAFRDVRSGSP